MWVQYSHDYAIGQENIHVQLVLFMFQLLAS